MITPMRWFDRHFTFDLPLGAFPAVIERLRGTPARAAELVAGVPVQVLTRRTDGKWSVQEHIAHLSDLGVLDDKRLGDFLARASNLSPADLQNRATETADHNRQSIAAVLEQLRAGRMELVRRMDTLTEEEVGRTAIHPRLMQPMRLMDWAIFVAEHDDHHLAHVHQALANAKP
jgi:DinB superfamily